jgi:outer membrane protein assembly factor BamB
MTVWRWLTCALLATSTGCTLGDRTLRDYPQWRGWNSDGGASAFVAPKVWPEALSRRWRVDVGEGYATPLVVGSRLYAFTRLNGRETMTALDARTGRILWRTSYAAPFTPSRPAAAHGAGPKATPLFHEGTLFTLGISGIVSAIDPQKGTLRWQTPAPSEAPYFGAAASPVGAPGVVIVHPGNYGPLTAFDVTTGATRWIAGGGGGFSSPIVATVSGVSQVISTTQKNVIGVAPADGHLLWQYPFAGANGATTPVVDGDSVIVSGLNLGVEAFRPARQNGGWMTTPLWQTNDVSMYTSNPVIVDETLFGLSHRSGGQFFALDVKTGRLRWLGQPREAANTAIVKAGQLLFLLNDDGELIVAKGDRARFEPVRRYSVADSATWAQPAISGNRLFVKDVSSLSLWTVDVSPAEIVR